MTPSIPDTMKAIVIERPGAPWALKHVPVPQPTPGEILVKVLACGVCLSDYFVQQGAFGTFPRIPGHEIIGVVAKTHESEERWKVGQKVGGGWHGAHDGMCKGCGMGLFQMCENKGVNGVSRDGGYAEYCLLRSEAVVRIPEHADPVTYAPLLCAGTAVFNSIRKMEIAAGATVAVQGIGGLGHLAIQYARRMGFRTIALSTSDSKKDFAMQLGATEYVNTSRQSAASVLQEMGGASLIIVTAPNVEVMSGLVGGLGRLGKLLILAPVGNVPFDTGKLLEIGGSVHVWPAGHALDSEEAIDFAERQGVKCMVEKFPLDKAEDAVKAVTSNAVRFRGVLVMD